MANVAYSAVGEEVRLLLDDDDDDDDTANNNITEYDSDSVEQHPVIRMAGQIDKISSSPEFKWTNICSCALGLWFAHWGSVFQSHTISNMDKTSLWLWCMDRRTDVEYIERSVRTLSQNLRDQGRGSYTIVKIGSYYNGTKKRPADEFDFLFEPEMNKDLQDLRFEHQSLASTETEGYSKPDLFRIYDSNNVELSADGWQYEFQRNLEKVLRQIIWLLTRTLSK